ncbi:APC family permease [Cryptosporangium sp. NPDC051539]|uniref:APC family permease n=1 Tax=Cryptosporangium sp. NPDC051539 TaxID=3363962 RepID=UPI0037BC2EFC
MSQVRTTPASHRGTRVLETRHLLMILFATHLPITSLWAIVPNVLQAGNVVATPLIFLLTGVILLGFVTSYANMARRLRHPGGLYVQITHGLGRPAGLGAAAVSLVGYLTLGAVLFNFIGLVLHGLTVSLFDVDLPIPVLIVAAIIAVSALGMLGLLTVVRLFTGVAVIQGLALALFVVGAFTQPAGGHVSLIGLSPNWLLSGSLGIALCYALTSSVGTDVGVNYNNELVDPERSVPRASYLAYGLMTAVLALSALAVSVAGGPEQVSDGNGQGGVPLMATVVVSIVGVEHAAAVTNCILVLLILGLLATGITYQNAISRQLAGLARDRVLPVDLSFQHPGTRLVLRLFYPIAAGVIALLVPRSVVYGVPLWLVIGSGLCVLTTLTLAAAAAFVWFLHGSEGDENLLGWEGPVVAGAFSVVVAGGCVLYGITHVSSFGSGTPGNASWYVAAMIVLPFALGVGIALVFRMTDPSRYRAIGRLGYGSGGRDWAADEATSPPPNVPSPIREEARW